MSPPSRKLTFAIGVICILVSLVEQNITLADGRYGPTLLKALAFTVAAVVCFVRVMWKDNGIWRTLAGMMMLPTLFVVADFLPRAPGAFQDVRAPSGRTSCPSASGR